MKVFAIIVLFNGKEWIDRCVGNLFKSTISLDVIVIDNGSFDGSVSYIKSNYPKVDLILSQENLGFGKANNIGIKRALEKDADFVFLLNQDAWVESNTIELLLKNHDSNFGVTSPMHLNGSGSALDFNFSKYLSIDGCLGFLSDLFLKKLKSELYEVNFVNAAAWLISRKCLDTVGGFNPAFFLYGEDDNYIHRLKYHGFKIGVLPKALIYHDREQRSDSSFFKQGILEKRSRLVNYSNPNNNADLKNDIKFLKRRLLKQMLLLRKQEVIKTKLLIEELEKNIKIIDQTFPLTKKEGRTFL